MVIHNADVNSNFDTSDPKKPLPCVSNADHSDRAQAHSLDAHEGVCQDGVVGLYSDKAQSRLASLGVHDAACEDTAESRNGRLSRKKWPWIAGGVVVVILALAYGIAGFMMSGTTPAHANISGVDVGGMTRVAAAEKLSVELREELASDHAVETASPLSGNKADAAPSRRHAQETDMLYTFEGQELQPRIDVEATLDPLVGFSWNPWRVWKHFFGETTAVARATFDEAGLLGAVKDTKTAFNRPAENATFTYNPETDSIGVTPSTEGIRVADGNVKDALEAQWLNGSGKIVIPVETAMPSIDTDEMTQFVDESVKPIIDEPVVVHVHDVTHELDSKVIGPWLVVDTSKESPAVTLNNKAASEAMAKMFSDALKKPENARIEIKNHTTPTIIESRDGVNVDAADLAQKLIALPDADSRVITAKTVKQPAEFTTEDAKKMGVKEVVSEIATPLTSDSHRTINLEVGSRFISNHVIEPGEQFNLQELLGEVSAERGFVNSGVSVNGLPAEGMGGGLSQVATNSFNVGYRAGMKDIEHQAHSTYYERYPMGMESTIWIPSINVIWENVTPYGVVVDSYVDGGKLVTKLWSTKYWDVKYWIGEPYAYTQPTVRDNNYPTCIPSAPGGPGFTVQWGRKITKDGEVVEDVTNTWTYAPHDGSRCVK